MSRLLSDFNSNAKINSNVARHSVYSDINISFDIHPITRDIIPVTDLDAVKNSVKNIALSNLFDRPFNTRLGSNLTALLFENDDPLISMKVSDYLQEAIRIHEPRVSTVDVDTVASDNSITVTVFFTITNSDQVYDTTFALNKLR
jgi:phage baseplate assembly protein W